MDDVSVVGIDLAKRVFQVRGAARDGSVCFRKRMSRASFLKFMSELAPCTVAMEACSTAHYWGRELSRLGHDVRLIPPELRQDIDQSTVAALMSTYTRCNRPKKRPERHAEVFGHCVKLNLSKGTLALQKEDVELPCPAEFIDQRCVIPASVILDVYRARLATASENLTAR